MNLQSTDVLWLIVALTSPWYYTSTLVLVLNASSAATYFSSAWHAACDLPIPPSFSNLHRHICPQHGITSTPILQNAQMHDEADSIHSIITAATYSPYSPDRLPAALVSIDDAIFLAKSSPIDCRDELVQEFGALEQGSRIAIENLEELKASLLSSVDL